MQPRWKDGAKGMLTVNALFAGFSGALLINLAARDWGNASVKLGCSVAFAAVALYVFAMAAERITDALDEGRVNQYMISLVLYNCGVPLILLSLALLLWDHVGRLGIAVVLFSYFPWVRDLLWLRKSQNRAAYLAMIATRDA